MLAPAARRRTCSRRKRGPTMASRAARTPPTPAAPADDAPADGGDARACAFRPRPRTVRGGASSSSTRRTVPTPHAYRARPLRRELAPAPYDGRGAGGPRPAPPPPRVLLQRTPAVRRRLRRSLVSGKADWQSWIDEARRRRSAGAAASTSAELQTMRLVESDEFYLDGPTTAERRATVGCAQRGGQPDARVTG